MKTAKTFVATIYVGMYNTDTRLASDIETVYDLCLRYVNERNLCVTVTPTRFIYNNGWEDGVAIGLINYPRFPRQPYEIKKIALELARLMKKEFQQKRLSVVFPDETIMLEENE